jgi:hypothetical protein
MEWSVTYLAPGFPTLAIYRCRSGPHHLDVGKYQIAQTRVSDAGRRFVHEFESRSASSRKPLFQKGKIHG